MKLGQRILIGTLGVVIGGQVVSTMLSLAATHDGAMDQTVAQLGVGRSVIQRDFAERIKRLENGVRVLAQDFGFKQAMALGDEPTVSGALLNHGHRIEATIAAAIHEDGTIGATTGRFPLKDGRFPLPLLLEQADANGAATRGVWLTNRPMLLVVAPVFGPHRIGWAALGFGIDQHDMNHLSDLVGAEVTLVGTGIEGAQVLSASGGRETLELEALLERGVLETNVWLNDQEYVAARFPLAEHVDADFDVIAFKALTAALAKYEILRWQMMAIMGFGILLSALIAWFLARAVTRPVGELVRAAQDIAEGEYHGVLHASGTEEVRALASSFTQMREAIAQRERRIRHQATHDALTGLFNRSIVSDLVTKRTAQESSFALLMVDLDRFKDINDVLGHEIGDFLLRLVAERLLENARSNDCVVRLGGDEFLIVVDGAGEDEALAAAQRLQSELGLQYRIGELVIHVRGSVGIVLSPQHGVEAADLLRRVDIAMYLAKTREDRLAMYRNGQEEIHADRITMVNDLRAALSDGVGLQMHYQPKVELGPRRCSEVEALIRWDDPQRGRVSPEVFVPLAEHSGLVVELTDWVLESVCSDIAKWRSEGRRLRVGVNLSAIDLVDQRLLSRVDSSIARHNIQAEWLGVEITESAVMADLDSALGNLRGLRERGISVAIDDFGTGHSSLAQLKRLPVDELKIDRSFVQDLGRDEGDLAIVRATIGLGHNLGLKLVAEGVETASELTVLEQMKCDTVQGYLMSRPLAGDDLLAWLTTYEESKDVNA